MGYGITIIINGWEKYHDQSSSDSEDELRYVKFQKPFFWEYILSWYF